MGENLTEEIVALSKEVGALVYGEFILASGQASSYYFDGRLLTLSPRGAHLVSRALLPVIRDAGAEAVGGPAVGAVPLVAGIAMLSGWDNGPSVPGFFVRKEAKDHGLGNTIEGSVSTGARVAIVDDVCSTAGSLYAAIEAVEAVGHEVVMVASILDRHQGGSDRLQREGYPFHAILHATADGTIGPE